MYKFNPIYNKKPQGASLINEQVEYNLQISKQINSTAVFLCVQKDFEQNITKTKMDVCEAPNNKEYLQYSAKLSFNDSGLYWYYFEVWQNEHKFYLQFTKNFEVEPTGDQPQKFQQTVIESSENNNKLYCGGVIYHIFVDRFCKDGEVKPSGDLILRKDWGGSLTKNSTNFNIINKECFGGNLKGIIKKLDYIKSLGVTTIYLSPIFEANSYHKYNTADYTKVDSMLGSQNDLKDLIKKAKKLNIQIVLDGVFNHVGADSIYFNKFNSYKTIGAFNSKSSKYFEWFEFQNYPNKYSSWWGIDTLPQVKKECPNFRNFIAGENGIIDNYMRMGLLGFRLDVADELSDNMLDEISTRIKQTKKDAVIIGEVWENASNKIAYSKRRRYFCGRQLNSVMNYPLKDAVLNYIKTQSVSELLRVIYMLKDNYPKEVLNNLMNILGTHDTSRILSVIEEICKNRQKKINLGVEQKLFSNNEENIQPNTSKSLGAKEQEKIDTQYKEQCFKLLKIATLLQFTLMGVPCVFYGDEIGLKGEGAPFCRVCFDWKNQNKSYQSWYKFLGELRSDPAFAGGELNIHVADKAVFVFDRTVGYHKVVICINAGDKTEKIELDGFYKSYKTKKNVSKSQTILPYDFKIFYR